jgi:hypothetical protein
MTTTRTDFARSRRHACDTYEEAISRERQPVRERHAIFARRRRRPPVRVRRAGGNGRDQRPIPVPVAYYSFGGWKSSLFGDRHLRAGGSASIPARRSSPRAGRIRPSRRSISAFPGTIRRAADSSSSRRQSPRSSLQSGVRGDRALEDDHVRAALGSVSADDGAAAGPRRRPTSAFAGCVSSCARTGGRWPTGCSAPSSAAAPGATTSRAPERLGRPLPGGHERLHGRPLLLRTLIALVDGLTAAAC